MDFFRGRGWPVQRGQLRVIGRRMLLPREQAQPAPPRRRSTLSAIALALALAGCAGSGSVGRAEHPLAVGRRGPSIQSAELSGGAKLVRRFARAYARNAYRRKPPRLPGESARVARALSLAAERVPPGRRHLRPHLAALRIWPLRDGALRAAAWIADRRNPPFSIGFTATRRGGRWLVTTVSPPE